MVKLNILIYVLYYMVAKHGLLGYIKGCRVREFENGILRRIFGPQMDKNGEWGKLHNEEPIVSAVREN